MTLLLFVFLSSISQPWNWAAQAKKYEYAVWSLLIGFRISIMKLTVHSYLSWTFGAANMRKLQPLNSLTQLHTGASKETEKELGSREYLWIKATHTYTPLQHYLMSPTRLQEQPHSLINNWSRREASLKYLVTKRAVENIVSGEHACIHCTQRKRQHIYETWKGKIAARWLRNA